MSTGELLDRPRDLRGEDSFDTAALADWLAAHVEGVSGIPEVRQFPGGASNLTYLLRFGERELILRRPPAGTKAASAHDMSREFLVQQRLKPEFDLVPEVFALCEDPGVIGSPFYVMERLRGIILRADLPPDLPLAPDAARALSEQAVDVLADLHAVDPGAVGLDTLGKGPGYVARQVSGWSRRYRAARTDNVPDFEAVMTWLDANQPADAGSCVIHNDYRLDNLVLDPESLAVIGVLDWEMATVGDPLLDLGCSLAYWVQADDDPGMQLARRQPTHVPGMLARDEVVARYRERSGLPIDDWTFYEVFGLFRLAAIAQQIYFRYHHGQTSNPAFADFWKWVSYCDTRCRRIAGITESGIG